jgi:hypothetical protein
VKSGIGDHNLFYGARVKCVKDNGHQADPELADFVDIRTIRFPDDRRSIPAFQLIKWWADNSLMGTDVVYCGYRSRGLFVKKIEQMKVSDMENMSGIRNKKWTKAECQRFLGRFLDFVRDTVTDDDPDMMIVFTWKPGDDVTWVKSRVTACCRVFPH